MTLLLLAPHAIAQGSYQHPETKFVFPAAIGEFDRTRVQRFPDAKHGVRVEYIVQGLGKADFYLYDYGISAIPDGVGSRAVVKAFIGAELDIEDMANSGQFVDFKRTIPPGVMWELQGKTPRFHASAYEFRANRENAEPVISWLLVTGARAHFLKVRFTHEASRMSDGQRALERLLTDFFAANHQ